MHVANSSTNIRHFVDGNHTINRNYLCLYNHHVCKSFGLTVAGMHLISCVISLNVATFRPLSVTQKEMPTRREPKIDRAKRTLPKVGHDSSPKESECDEHGG